MKNLINFSTCLLAFFLISQPLSAQLFLTSADNVKGWNWDGQTASYVADLGGETYLFVRPFDGHSFKPVTLQRKVRSNIRGWSWDGKTASYFAVVNGKTYLHIRPFDGENYGPPSQAPIFMGSTDNFLSWSWDGRTAVYNAILNGRSYKFVRPFDGKTFQPVQQQIPYYGPPIRGYSVMGGLQSYTAFVKGQTELFIQLQ